MAVEFEYEVNAKNADFLKAQDYFYNVEVAQITSRHMKEIAEMEDIITQQLRAVSNFQQELNKLRSEIIMKEKSKK